MSKPALKDLYNPEGRRGRQSYLYFNAAYYFILGLGFKYLEPINALLHNLNTGEGGYGASVFMLLVAPFMLANLFVTAQRCRDFGLTGWTAVLLFVPYLAQVVKLILCFIPDTKGDNKYGPDVTQAPTNNDAPVSQDTPPQGTAA